MRKRDAITLDEDSGTVRRSGLGIAPDRPLGLKMTVVARLMRSQFDHSASVIGMTRAQWSMLTAVAGAEGCTQRVLAALLEVTEVTAGRMIDRLVDEGLVERRHDPSDRRAYRIYLTPQASPVLETLRELGDWQEQRLLAGLSETDIHMLHDLLDCLAANLNAPFDDKSATIRRLIESSES